MLPWRLLCMWLCCSACVRNTLAAFPSRRKAPSFMVELFDAAADPRGVTRNSRHLAGNVIRSYEDRAPLFDHNLHLFNLSSLNKNEKLIRAEFRWFRNKQNSKAGKSPQNGFYKLAVYEVQESAFKLQRRPVCCHFFSSHSQGWEVFNVTTAVSKWIQSRNTNKGLLAVSTLPCANDQDTSLPSGKPQAYLVIFSDDGRKGSNMDRLALQAYLGQRKEGSLHPPEDVPRVQENRRRKPRATTPYQSFCQRLPLYVDFEKMGWSDWIISPRGYEAYHCQGSCPFPLGGPFSATNHATVQSIVQALKLSGEVQRPCCVPDQLRSISLLYFDEHENVVLKQYEDMVAVSCGCH